MKQEHRFVAELYRYLSPFIDSNKPIYLSLDGIAASKGVQEKLFKDADVPDLWFYLIGASTVTQIEAKVVDHRGRVTLGQRQLNAWRTGGRGKHKPSAWIATDINFKLFYYWEHNHFLPALDACRSKQQYVHLRAPTNVFSCNDIRKLALRILRVIQANTAEDTSLIL